MIKATILVEELNNKKYDELLNDIYADTNLLDYQRERYVKAINKYVSLYGDTDVEIYSAPGRSEVGGNHTDHQHGEVLAAAINLDIIAVVAPTKETIKVLSDDYDIQGVNIKDLEKRDQEVESSEGLIRGVCARYQQLGYKIGGFNA